MSRYSLPDPRCDHAPTQRVTSGDLGDPSGVHASTYVCGRPACVEDAKAWAFASTHVEPVVAPLRHSVAPEATS